MLVLATILRAVIIKMAEFALISSRSRFARFIMIPIVFQYFITYVLVQLLATFDLRDWGIFGTETSFFNAFEIGIYKDFTSNWFIDAGYLIKQIMFYNILMPPLEFCAYWLWRYLWRIVDQRSIFVSQYKKTRCTSIQQFTETYAGGEFYIHYKYAYIASCCFITMTFGPIMPVLFWYCLLSLCSLYFVERMAMIYSYRKPPMYGDHLTVFLLKLLSLAPFLYITLALWAFSNQ